MWGEFFFVEALQKARRALRSERQARGYVSQDLQGFQD